ncbi:hypothetical protein ACH4E7_44790 [Kitasatospora sp. NPDC018058]|uniref:hypothetical protein n=1 Tax=Kitasatospora sp. NPDC018058 TaxID=3364025 RepID=UPI0037BF2C33
MASHPTATSTRVDPALLSLELRHQHRLTDRSGDGLQVWSARIDADGEPIGTLRAARCLYWRSGNLYDRMTDEGGFLAHVAAQVLTPDGQFSQEFEEAVEMPNSLLVVDHLDLPSPWQHPVVAAALVAALIDRFTNNHYAVVLPTTDTATVPGAALLHQAAELLAADEYDEGLLVIDTCLAAPERAAAQVRQRLQDLSQHGMDYPYDEADEEDEWELTPRTRTVLRLALEDLGQMAWAEVAALGDEQLTRKSAGLFASLPRLTFGQDSGWRRQMARTFDDLAADLTAGRDLEPGCTGEEMALHLAISRAREIATDRPRLVAAAVEGLPVHRYDLDWEACSDLLFQDHDVLMLFDASMDGIEDPGNQVNQMLGMVNLGLSDWFTPFDPDCARDPARGFRHI